MWIHCIMHVVQIRRARSHMKYGAFAFALNSIYTFNACKSLAGKAGAVAARTYMVQWQCTAVGKGRSVATCKGAVTNDELLTVLRVMALSVMGFEAATLLILCDLTILPPLLCVCACRVCCICVTVIVSHEPIPGTVPCTSLCKTHRTPETNILTARHPRGEARLERPRLRGCTRSWSKKRRSQPAAWGWLFPASVHKLHARRARENWSSAACATATIISTNMSAFCTPRSQIRSRGQTRTGWLRVCTQSGSGSAPGLNRASATAMTLMAMSFGTCWNMSVEKHAGSQLFNKVESTAAHSPGVDEGSICCHPMS